MPRLSGSDYERVLDLLRLAHDLDEEPFSEPVLEALRRLIPSFAVSYHVWSARGYRCAFAADDRAAIEGVWPAYRHVRQQDPLPGGGPGAGTEPSAAPVGRATRFSDLMGLRAFRRLDLHAEVCRPLGVDYVMKLFLPSAAGERSAFVFDRQPRDFTDRDRHILDLLYPHFVQLRARARMRSSVPFGAAELTPREREIMAWVARGKRNAEIARLLWIAPGTVRKHLDNVYAKLGVSNRTQAVLRAGVGPSRGPRPSGAENGR